MAMQQGSFVELSKHRNAGDASPKPGPFFDPAV